MVDSSPTPKAWPDTDDYAKARAIHADRTDGIWISRKDHEAEVTSLRTQLDEAVRLLRLTKPFTIGNMAYDYIGIEVDAFLSAAALNKEEE